MYQSLSEKEREVTSDKKSVKTDMNNVIIFPKGKNKGWLSVGKIIF